MVANILPTDTPSTQGWGQKVKLYLSESSHVAYQIKADDAGSNKVANILPTDTLSTIINFFSKYFARRHTLDHNKLFQNMVMLHIKLKLTMLAAT